MALLTFIIFIILMFGAQLTGITMIVPLAAGFVLFSLLALKRGFDLKFVLSMAEVAVILIISGGYGGIFKGTGILSAITDRIEAAGRKIGRFPTMFIEALLLCAVFCNQTITAIMQKQLSDGMYSDDETGRTALMSDIENTTIPLAGMVPWGIACSVPLGMMGVSSRALLFSFYLWLVPVYNLIIQMVKSKKDRARHYERKN